VHTGLGGCHRVVLVMDRRCWTGQVVDFIDLYIKRERDIVAHQLEMRVFKQIDDVVLAASKEVIDTDNIVAFVKQSLAEV